MAMKIYIAGKVSGMRIDECTMKFGIAQKLIEAQGHEAVNPLQIVNDWHATWPNAMKKCLAALMECDAIYPLPCALDSRGAMIELDLARKLEIPLYKLAKK